jgi:hypothetical protein
MIKAHVREQAAAGTWQQAAKLAMLWLKRAELAQAEALAA